MVLHTRLDRPRTARSPGPIPFPLPTERKNNNRPTAGPSCCCCLVDVGVVVIRTSRMMGVGLADDGGRLQIRGRPPSDLMGGRQSSENCARGHPSDSRAERAITLPAPRSFELVQQDQDLASESGLVQFDPEVSELLEFAQGSPHRVVRDPAGVGSQLAVG